MTNVGHKKLYSSFTYAVPWIVFSVGFLISLILWATFLFVRYSDRDLIIVLGKVLPWILLVIGILLSFICSITIWIIQLIKERTQSLTRINQDFQKESAERA